MMSSKASSSENVSKSSKESSVISTESSPLAPFSFIIILTAFFIKLLLACLFPRFKSLPTLLTPMLNSLSLKFGVISGV